MKGYPFLFGGMFLLDRAFVTFVTLLFKRDI